MRVQGRLVRGTPRPEDDPRHNAAAETPAEEEADSKVHGYAPLPDVTQQYQDHEDYQHEAE